MVPRAPRGLNQHGRASVGDVDPALYARIFLQQRVFLDGAAVGVHWNVGVGLLRAGEPSEHEQRHHRQQDARAHQIVS